MGTFASTSNVVAQAGDPGAIGAGSLWSDTDAEILYRRNDADTTWIQVALSNDLTTVRTDTSLTAGEDLSINELVMIDAVDNEVHKCTSAKSSQAIGVMLAAVSNTTAFTAADMATYGIVTMIAGAAISIGDKLTCDTGTAGRVIALNSSTTAADHSHTAFTLNDTIEAGGAPTSIIAINEGSGGGKLVRSTGTRVAGLGIHTATGSVNTTCTTSTDGATTLTHGTVIGKALSAAASGGDTFKALLCLTG